MKRLFGVCCLFVMLITAGHGQSLSGPAPARSQEVTESDGVPVLLKHLPDWENIRGDAIFANDLTTLKRGIPDEEIVDLVDFTGGTEAVTAPYPAGRLLIIEYASPQASIEADARFRQFLLERPDGPATAYRRIGNYNAFVFGAADEAAANALLDQVKYEKNIQWLGEDPFLFQRLERAFVITTTDIFVSTVKVIVLGFGLSIVAGFIVGLIFFRVRDKHRLSMKSFSDAGGMIRLNLDGLTPDTLPQRLLKD